MAALGLTGIVAVLLLLPNAHLPMAAPDQTDVVLHVLVMGSMGFVQVFGWPRALGTVALVLVALAIGLEVAQLWVPGRYFAVTDLVANLAGAGAGGWLGRWNARRVTRA